MDYVGTMRSHYSLFNIRD